MPHSAEQLDETELQQGIYYNVRYIRRDVDKILERLEKDYVTRDQLEPVRNLVLWPRFDIVIAAIGPDSDQASADCCVAEATSYFQWQLTGKKMSVRSVFAYIAQAYGAFLRDGP